ncbi:MULTISPECIES: hypothetical protein [Kitasatospora]|uniref:Uncharacterized protein n=1 Tax=Kitasatospora setae (strain ATCC 33774 / DSM 43861 / JCM 3304 / KCC A-0304 / NBRC 14216 / KM-6054) TaxID=452652 RepID=E4NBS4_KITSK|nr:MULTISPECIES: hypothetical protein [Kitasatospora]BAJ28655.1 hypothetical protein KSE_28440 [Kitasatospora setae KM-6054]
MSTGNGFQIEVDNLRAFAAQVRRLLSEFEGSAGSSEVYGRSGISPAAFGDFPEAQALHAKYSLMRSELSSRLQMIQDAIDSVQQKADYTANNYDEQEQDTRKHVTLASDGWTPASSPGSTNPNESRAITPDTTGQHW